MKQFLKKLVAGTLGVIAILGLWMTLEGGPVIGLVVCVVIMFGFYWQHRQEQKNLRTPVAEIDNQDRPLVLYLRSFNTEESDRKIRGRLRESFFGHFISGVSNPLRDEEQEALAKIFEHIGLYVAIGRPGEHLPCPGARKVYVSDDQWQAVVSRWIDRSAAIILEPGIGGEGLAWEIGEIFSKVSPEKVLIILPRIHADYQPLRESLAGSFPKPFPERVKKGTRLIMFDGDWVPEPAASLYPFFRQNGFEYPES